MGELIQLQDGEMTQEIECPSCGAPIPSEQRFQDQILCPYCGAQAYVGDATKALAADTPAGAETAEHATLATVYSRFSVGDFGVCDWGQGPKKFSVEGRVQFEYEGGYWSEWYLDVEGVGYWLQEDEGIYLMFIELPIENKNHLLDLYDASQNSSEGLPMGRKMPVLNSTMGDWFLTESGVATLRGTEGQVPKTLPPGHKILYFDGCGGGYRYTIELWNKGQEGTAHQGWPLEFEQITMESERGDTP